MGMKIYEKPRGHPDNTGNSLSTVHPVIRTNPVTGWKSVFALGAYVRIRSTGALQLMLINSCMTQVKCINGLHRTESDVLLQWLMDIVVRNHDLQCRFKWKNSNDMGALSL